MNKSLVIVESPGKIAKISKILGNDYIVKASVGHIRNLDPKKLSIDINNNFKPEYVIIKDKKKVVNDLKNTVKECKEVILAADEDREGEAIAASLAEVLNLKKPKRIVFNAITKTEILNALKKPRLIDDKLVDAQKARMILDKIVGYRLSPLLWNNISHGLSGGRVQSVVVKIVIDREDKIEDFNSENNFKVIGIFFSGDTEMKCNLFDIEKKDKNNIFKGNIFKTKLVDNINKLFGIFANCKFEVSNIFDKKSQRNPSPPFITSSLQQEASYKLGYNPKKTMSVAQKLYEHGYITYMRTDSTNLSKEALNDCKIYIKKTYGNKYFKERIFSNKSKNAQEAHEAIRPTKIEKDKISGSNEEIRLYNLIWKRTVASQMSPAEINNKIIQLEIVHKKKLPYYFESSIETIDFNGFLIVYNLKNNDDDEDENKDNNKNITIPKKGNILKYKEIIGNEEYSKSIGRYNEASLVKELESKGIGRPSTFANVISKIQDKGYVERKNINGEKKEIKIITLKNGSITNKSKEITLGKEKNKLVPTNTGRLVTNYLLNNFDNIMDYKFTANMEESLDKIANGESSWLNVLKDFYNPFDEIYTKLNSFQSTPKNNGDLLGIDPQTKKQIFKTTTKYGPVVKLVGESNKDIKYASLVKPLTLNSITLQDAINLLKYPINLGMYNDKVIELCKGQYGFYVKHDSKNYQVNDDEIKLDDVICIIKKKDNNLIKELKDKTKSFTIKNGEYGPYISYKSNNKTVFKSIPKNIEAKNITLEQINKLIKMPKKSYKN